MSHNQQSDQLNFTFATPANLITSIRILLAPFVLLAQQTGGKVGLWAVVAIIFVAEFTDFLDGVVARATDKVSDAGKLLDPLADSLFRSLLFMGFMASGWMPVWMLAITIGRDILVAYGRIFAALSNTVLAARISGKVKAIVQGAAQMGVVVLYLLDHYDFGYQTREISYWLLLTATLVTGYSAVDYVTHVIKTISKKG